MQSRAKIVCIGPGHGLCLQSGKLVTAGVIKFNKHTQLCLITSADTGNTWKVIPVPSSCSPENVSFGKHTQIVEYAKDKVCITCSLENCHQRFTVFSSDGCKTFHGAKLEPKLIEANPGCQAGIICISSLDTKEKMNVIAFTNPASELQFENLSLRVSRDGCKTWSPPLLTLRKAFAKSSDLAYYKFEGSILHRDRGGLACVYENTTGNKTECNSILMQLISQDQIKNSLTICESK